jgi:hypothetical protein
MTRKALLSKLGDLQGSKILRTFLKNADND